jgi:hypothetical protein
LCLVVFFSSVISRGDQTAATRWLQSGINILKIKDWLGHSSLEITQGCLDDVNPSGEDVQAKIDKAGRL